jgi:hypothetical protein
VGLGKERSGERKAEAYKQALKHVRLGSMWQKVKGLGSLLRVIMVEDLIIEVLASIEHQFANHT